ncbi:MAG: beta-ketoacyl-[acyl-carrier-protein] synthase family protein [Gammaproteobacteria bacterium]
MVDNDIKAAVTGMAWTTALGNDLDLVWARLLSGESGLRHLSSHLDLRNELVASVDSQALPGEKIDEITRSTIELALKDSGVDPVSSKIMLIVGTSFGARLDDERSNQSQLHLWVDKIAADLGLTSVVLSTACSSGSDAILAGSALIKAGYADICICGGADILGDSKRLAHSALGTMSQTFIRSFDKQRDGTILGEGAGFVVLEKYTKSLNKKVYALLNGCGSANDASGLTAPDEKGNGITLAIQRSLNNAKLDKSKIQLINAHGSGTLTNDMVEAKAYKRFFDETKPYIFATKGAFGHSLGATGALEAIALIMALQAQVIPPINNLTDPLEGDSFVFPVTKAWQHNAFIGLSLTIGFGGFNTSLIFEKVS